MHRFWSFQLLLTSLPIIVFVTIVSHVTFWVRIKRDQKLAQLKSRSQRTSITSINDIPVTSSEVIAKLGKEVNHSIRMPDGNNYKSPRGDRFVCCNTRKLVYNTFTN